MGNQAVNIKSYNVTHTVRNLCNSTSSRNRDKEPDVQTSYQFNSSSLISRRIGLCFTFLSSDTAQEEDTRRYCRSRSGVQWVPGCCSLPKLAEGCERGGTQRYSKPCSQLRNCSTAEPDTNLVLWLCYYFLQTQRAFWLQERKESYAPQCKANL